MAGTSYIMAGARTPIAPPGRGPGPLFSAAELGGMAIEAALERAGVAPDQDDFVFMGHVLQAGQGQITARQAAAAAGIPMSTPVDDGQQGLPVRTERHPAGQHDDPDRPGRHRGGRGHGVDDQRPLPPARGSGRLPPG